MKKNVLVLCSLIGILLVGFFVFKQINSEKVSPVIRKIEVSELDEKQRKQLDEYGESDPVAIYEISNEKPMVISIKSEKGGYTSTLLQFPQANSERKQRTTLKKCLLVITQLEKGFTLSLRNKQELSLSVTQSLSEDTAYHKYLVGDVEQGKLGAYLFTNSKEIFDKYHEDSDNLEHELGDSDMSIQLSLAIETEE